MSIVPSDQEKVMIIKKKVLQTTYNQGLQKTQKISTPLLEELHSIRHTILKCAMRKLKM